MRWVLLILLIAGCTAGSELRQGGTGRDYHTVEYFNAGFDRVVDATYSSVASLGMYVEDRYRSGLDQVISVQTVRMGQAGRLLITVAQPTAQGVAVTVTSESESVDTSNLEQEAAAIFRKIELNLGM